MMGLNELLSLNCRLLLPLQLLGATLQHEVAAITVVVHVHGARAVVEATRLIDRHGIATIHRGMLLALLLELALSLLLPGLHLCANLVLLHGQAVLVLAHHFFGLQNGGPLDVGTHRVCHCLHHCRTVLGNQRLILSPSNALHLGADGSEYILVLHTVANVGTNGFVGKVNRSQLTGTILTVVIHHRHP